MEVSANDHWPYCSSLCTSSFWFVMIMEVVTISILQKSTYDKRPFHAPEWMKSRFRWPLAATWTRKNDYDFLHTSQCIVQRTNKYCYNPNFKLHDPGQFNCLRENELNWEELKLNEFFWSGFHKYPPAIRGGEEDWSYFKTIVAMRFGSGIILPKGGSVL